MLRSKNGLFYFLVFAIVLADRTAAADDYMAIATMMKTHCADCHAGDAPESGLNLESIRFDWSDRESIRTWESILQQVDRGLMPPEDSAKLTSAERKELANRLRSALTTHSPVGGEMRRLSRREYVNTVQVLLDMDSFTLPNTFPPESSTDGFDNHIENLVLAPAHLQGYVDAATQAAEAVFPEPVEQLEPAKFTVEASDLVISYSSACLIDNKMRLASSGQNERRHATWPTKFIAPRTGTYKVSLVASSLSNGMLAAPMLSIGSMEPNGAKNRQEHGTYRVPPSENASSARTIEFEMKLGINETPLFRFGNGPYDYDDKNAFKQALFEIFKADPRLAAAWEAVGEPARGGSGWERVKEALNSNLDVTRYQDTATLKRLANKYGQNSVKTGETLAYKYFEEGPYIAIHRIEITGPFAAEPTPAEKRAKKLAAQLLGIKGLPSGASDLSELVEVFLSRAFRRTATSHETASYVQLAMQEHERTGKMDAALHLVIRTALTSPSFLFRGIEAGQLDACGIATRLAYFLTSNPPDDTLLAVANAGKLHSLPQLREQAVRLLEEPKSDLVASQFANDFTTGWLQLATIDRLMPDTRLIRKFDDGLRNAIREEPANTFAHVLANNLSARELIAAEFVIADPRLVNEIYGMDAPVGRKTKKPRKGVQLYSVERFGHAGGLISMPAVMMTTANGVDTQPVLRGVWMLRNIFGNPPPEPPNSVPALTPDTTGATSPKQRLAKHTTELNCAVCHRDIDPLGFALENFDPIGRWREAYPVYETNAKGKATRVDGAIVDATGGLPDGTELSDVTDLKRWLYDNPHPFVNCLAHKLMEYATGRTLNLREQSIVSEVVQTHANTDYRLQDLLLDLIETDVFLTR